MLLARKKLEEEPELIVVAVGYSYNYGFPCFVGVGGD